MTIDTTANVYIVMPVHNREKLLERAVESVFAQTYGRWSLMIVDDNSTDATPCVIKRLLECDPRIHTKLNSEYSHSCAGARLSGLLERQGDYLAFLDSDDQWPAYHLETCLSVLEKKSGN